MVAEPIPYRVVVGSASLYVMDIINDKPKDVDIWSSIEEKPLKGFDIKNMPENIIQLILQHAYKHGVLHFASLDDLYTIKLSHMVYDNSNWAKYKQHLLILIAAGASINQPLYELLKEYWRGLFGNKDFLSLKKTKDNFFIEDTPLGLNANKKYYYKYDHDWLHETVAAPNAPMYTKALTQGEQVLIDPDRVKELLHDEKIRMFQEEVAVIAFERFIVSGITESISKAWSMALRKTITQLTKNWASEFILENFKHFYKPDYFLFTNLLTNTEEGRNMTNENKKAINKLQEILTKHNFGYEVDDCLVVALADDDCDYWSYRQDDEDKAAEDFESLTSSSNYKRLDGDGGGEGGAEYVWGIFQIDDTLFRVDWSYYSYHGYEIDGALSTLRIVKPVQKMVTVYE